MSIPLPEGCHFDIKRRIIPADYEMSTFEAASNYYELGYFISGDRTIITPNLTYTQHAGYVGTMSPFDYHRTIPASQNIYESILIKFTLEFAKPFTDTFGMHTLDKIYSHPANRFDADVQQQILDILLHMLEEFEGDSPYKDFALQCMLFQIFVIILEKRLPDEEAIIHSTPLTPPIIEAIYFMERHYKEKLTLESVADAAGFSPAHFSRLFQAQLGKPYSEYLSDIRLRHVRADLLNTKKSITEIALESGYAYPANLTEQFKRRTGMTPMEYRKSGKIRKS